MSLPADAPNVIPRAQLALYIRGPDGEPLNKIIQDVEEQQSYTLGTLPAQIAAAQADATAAGLAAAAAQGTATAAASKLANASFLTADDEDASLPNGRRVVAGAGIGITDGGAGNDFEIALSDANTILAADFVDNTAAFVDVTGMVAALEASSTYLIEGALTFQSAGAGVGIGLSITLPAGASISGGYDHNLTTTTLNAAFNIASGTVSANTTGVPVINSNTPIRGRWLVKTGGTAGNAQLRMRSGAAATNVTLKQDLSLLIFKKIG